MTRDLDNGMSRALVDLPTLSMDLWLTQLHAFASPRRGHLGQADVVDLERRDPETATRVSYPNRLAQASCTMLERIPQGVLPAHGGDATTLVVTIDEGQLVPAQRKAMAERDRECRAAGCNVPAAWCEAHHLRPWSAGGRTDLADGILLCGFHHHRAHDRRYDQSRLPGGDVRFHRRR